MLNHLQKVIQAKVPHIICVRNNRLRWFPGMSEKDYSIIVAAKDKAMVSTSFCKSDDSRLVIELKMLQPEIVHFKNLHKKGNYTLKPMNQNAEGRIYEQTGIDFKQYLSNNFKKKCHVKKNPRVPAQQSNG